MFHLPLPIEGRTSEPTRIITRQSRGYTYNILKYRYLDNNDSNVEMHSEFTVVTDESQTKVFAYMAPRLTTHLENIYSNSPTEQCEDQIIEVKAAIEGTMVTFFWNDDTEEWNFCTKNGIGGDYSYFRPVQPGDPSPKTFREMVLDAFQTSIDIEIPGTELTEINSKESVLHELSKSHCYTCILQHPENHIVYNTVPACSFLRLIAIYERNAMPPLVSQDSTVCYRECIREIPLFDHRRTNEHSPTDPQTIEDNHIRRVAFKVFGNPFIRLEYLTDADKLRDFKELIFEIYREFEYQSNMNVKIKSTDINNFSDYNNNSFYYPPAWIFTNKSTGHISEVVNPFYEHAKRLRNIQPNMRYQYLDIRKNNLLQDYLHAFPRYFEPFRKFTKEYETFITEVHCAYVKFYILKMRENIPKQYFVHAARIHHNIYLAINDPSHRQKVTRKTVCDYFDMFDTAKMYYFLTSSQTTRSP